MDDRERARQRYEQRTASSWYKLSEGENTFRVLPTPKSAKTDGSFIEFMLHREVGPRKQMVRCGKDVHGKGKCWICDTHIPSLRKKGLETRASALAAKPNFTVQVAKVADDGKMSGPMIFQPAKSISDQILSMFFSKKKVYHDAVKGYNLTINRTGTGRNDTRYGMIEADEEPSKVPQAILSKLKPFSELTEIPTYSEAKQKAAVSGKDLVADDEDEEEDEEEQVVDDEGEEDGEEEDEEEDEEEEPKPAKKSVTKKTAAPAKKAAAKKPTVVEEEDDEEEDEEEEADEEDEVDLDDEEEEEPPAKVVNKKASPVKKPPVVEEEEEEEEINLDDEEEEEEEEPPPPPKKAPAKKAVKKK